MGKQFQHYTSRFYLKRFAVKQGKGHLVWRFDKYTGERTRANIKNFAGEMDFNDFHDKDGNKIDVESVLGKFEGEIAPAYNNFCINPTPANLPANRNALAHLISQFSVRTPTTRQEINEVFGLIIKRMVKEKFGDIDERLLPVLSEDTVKGQQALIILEAARNARLLDLTMKWVIVNNNTGIPFWTSDCPVIKYNDNKRNLGKIGLVSPGIYIITPMSPTLALIVCDPNAFPHYEPAIQAVPEMVNHFNRLQVGFAKQYIFSIVDDFSLAESFLEKHLILRDSTQPRIYAISNNGDEFKGF